MTAPDQTTPELVLTYFDFDGGRGEPARLALSIGGIPFTDERIAPRDFGPLKLGFPFGTLPVLTVDGERISQSNAINRYVGQLTGLYPSDPVAAAHCDEVMEALEDMNHKFARSLHIKDPEKFKARRTAVVEGPLSFTLERVEALLRRRGGEYFAAGRLTVADLKVYVWTRTIMKGTLDYVPSDLVARLAPTLLAHYERVSAHPGIVAYYRGRGA